MVVCDNQKLGWSKIESAEDTISKLEVNNRLEKMLEENLTKVEVTVLIHKLGLFGEEPKKGEDISKIIKLTRTRVSQLEHQAMDKLKANKGRYL